ncbi:MAG TPA: sigma-70 family RNA polymerase sigma factor [Candidatus Nitrosopolaris sp.]|nr:sigma-70 family RNA polymerase sigma factor [Candidatus Nitrosopolaris sp.]
MMRVTRIVAGDTLRVEGRLTHQSTEELRMACETVLSEQGALQLDVSGLQFVDPSGVALLRDLSRRGARLGGCSGFLTELLREREESPSQSTPPSDGDGALVERLRAGDPDAFETLVRQYGGRMLATARRLVGTEDDARDAVQEAFLAAFRAIDTFAGTARLSTWLHRIVLNAGLMKLRSRRRRREEPIDDLLPRFDEDGYWAEPTSAWAMSSDVLLERRETRTMVRNAIDRLPANYRSVLLLRDIEELDTDEVASLLGVTPNAVKTRLHRARQALRTLLEREFVGQAHRAPSDHGAARPA